MIGLSSGTEIRGGKAGRVLPQQAQTTYSE